MAKKKPTKKKTTKNKIVATITHDEDRRSNIPTAELEPVVSKEDKAPITLKYPRNPDLDPQLVWRGKDEQDWSDLVVGAPPLYIQEKVHPKVLIDDLLKETKKQDDRDDKAGAGLQLDLFGDFNGLPDEARSTEFYQHEANWTNRMILGDSLQVMASLAEREGLRGKVQCIYIDPPYGIKFNSNFQWSTTSRDVKDGKSDHITREPEQVKAFRDTWRDGIHSYLTYLRDRLTVCRDLLTESGSIFMQIGDENVHRVRTVLDEVFGDSCFVASIEFTKTSVGLQASNRVAGITDTLLWYCKNEEAGKYRKLLEFKGDELDPQYTSYLLDDGSFRSLTKDEKQSFPEGLEIDRVMQATDLTKPGPGAKYAVTFNGTEFESGRRWWGTTKENLERTIRAGRVVLSGSKLRYARRFVESRYSQLSNLWTGFLGQTAPTYVVQTNTDIVQRCILMTTDPGDLVLDPTCGSGTTAYVAEEWGRRWITIDTSRVALALARSRIMAAKYPFFFLADSPDGKVKESEISRTPETESPSHYNIRHGFVYDRVPQISPSVVGNNLEIDVIWEQFQEKLEPLREDLNKALKQEWEEWEIPREAEEDWSKAAKKLHADWWKLRIERQQEIDASIAAKADFEYLYDRPYEDKSKVRVAGPFTVESLSPHRILGVDHDDELIDPADQVVAERELDCGHGVDDFVGVILENLKTSGVQQSAKEDKINFTTLTGWPGSYICAEGRYTEGDAEDAPEKKAGVFIGPEFGTVSRQDLVLAVRECADAGFDVLIACAFNYEAHASEFNKLGNIPVLKARMNADLHMADDLKNTGKGNLFVIFGEPDIAVFAGGSEALANEIKRRENAIESRKEEVTTHNKDLKEQKDNLKKLKSSKDDDKDEKVGKCTEAIETLTERIKSAEYQIGRYTEFLEYAPDIPENKIVVEIYGVDVFHPNSGEVRSDSTDGIACWFIDTDYNEESFFVRQAYFLGAGDPYKSLKTTLKAEINQEAWDTLNSDTSRPFKKPDSGRIAVKVINHLGDEVMKVFKVE